MKSQKHLQGKRNSWGQFICDEPIFSELKFRLFNKNTKTIRIYTLATLIGTTFRRGQFEFRGRFTGKLDKNEEEIFEFDLVKTSVGICQVLWNNEYATYVLQQNDGFLTEFSGSITHLSQIDKEVIGNIYENPKLLNL